MGWLADLDHCSGENLMAVFGVLAGLECWQAWMAWVTAGPLHEVGTGWLCLAWRQAWVASGPTGAWMAVWLWPLQLTHWLAWVSVVPHCWLAQVAAGRSRSEWVGCT